MSENQNIKNLLSNVEIISKKYDEIAKITGEKFNIFSIMNMEWNEVYTHSAIIGELLNPKGSHGQGSVFLELFVDLMNKKFNLKIEKFGDLVNEKICERTISISNDWDNVTGGRIDIIIEDSKQIIIIENKPSAKDQEYQLIRYYNYAKTRNKEFYILYLTMEEKILDDEVSYKNGHEEIKGFNFHYSKKDEYLKFKRDNVDKKNFHYCLYYPITFSKEIVEWINECIEKASTLPIVRETLFQYIYLIKKLTNQTTNNKMSEEIVEILSKNVKGSFEVSANISDLKAKLYRDFIKHIIDYAKENDMDVDDFSEEEKKYGVYMQPKEWQEKQYKICVIFQFNNYSNLYYGLKYADELTNDEKENEIQVLKEKFEKNIYINGDNHLWQYHTKKDWDDSETWVDVAKGKDGEVYKEVIKKINEIIAIEQS